ncbi:hypothetical protein HDV05_001502 [Chytridiales sp. JEL 0842]|nr:hypothetical protein HDV05_001502 [Chytridiales sp. JEL 0842]
MIWTAKTSAMTPSPSSKATVATTPPNHHKRNRIKPRATSSYNPPSHYHLPPTPAPTTLLPKLSHSLPLPIHLLLTSLSSTFSTSLACLTHLIDGPLKHSWNLPTSMLIAAVKATLEMNPPQGRHSMWVAKTLSKLAHVPTFLTGSQVWSGKVEVEGSLALRKVVRSVVDFDEEIVGDVDLEMKEKVWFGCQRSATQSLSAKSRTLDAEWVMHKSVAGDCQLKKDSKVILYLHGGAHYFLSPRSHRGITSNISYNTKSPVLALDYRLAPDFMFPSAIEDALAAYLALLGKNAPSKYQSIAKLHGQPFKHLFSDSKEDVSEELNLKPEQIVIMGDSSGGCLTLQLLTTLKALGIPQPSSAVLLSPFLDHSRTADSWRRNWNTDILSLDPHGIHWSLLAYASHPSIPISHHVVSPIHGNLEGLAPILIQAGESEVLVDDSIKLHTKIQEIGGSSELQVFADMWHVFQAFPITPLADIAFRKIGSFVSTSDSGKAPESPLLSPSECSTLTETTLTESSCSSDGGQEAAVLMVRLDEGGEVEEEWVDVGVVGGWI